VALGCITTVGGGSPSEVPVVCLHRSLVESCGINVSVPLPTTGGSEASGFWGVDNGCGTFLLPELRVGISAAATTLPGPENSVQGELSLNADSVVDCAEHTLPSVPSSLDDFMSPVRAGAVATPATLLDGITGPVSGKDAVRIGDVLGSPSVDDKRQSMEGTPAGMDEARSLAADFPPCPDACRSEMWSSYVLATRCAFKLKDVLFANAVTLPFLGLSSFGPSLVSPSLAPLEGRLSLNPAGSPL
jgi:hypothetical protein